jgi:hypothetical protein
MIFNVLGTIYTVASLLLTTPAPSAVSPTVVQEPEVTSIFVPYVCLEPTPLIELGGLLNRYAWIYGDIEALPQEIKRQVRDILESYRMRGGICQYDPNLRASEIMLIRRDENPKIVYSTTLSDGSLFQVVQMPLYALPGYPNAPEYIFITKIGTRS